MGTVTFVYRLRWAGMALLRDLFCRLPAPLALSLGERAGDLLRHFLPRKRAILRDNLAKSDLVLRGMGEIRDFEKKVFRHFGRLGAEVMRLKALSDPEIARMVSVEGLEHFRSEFGKGRGVILLTGHIGNWEYSLRRIALEAPGKVHPVIRRIKSPVVHDFVDKAARDRRVNFTRGGKYSLDADGVAHLEELLVQQISAVSGGPLKYAGRDMKTTHAGMKITEEQFQAIADDLVQVLKTYSVGDKEISELMGIIATTKKEIVEAP